MRLVWNPSALPIRLAIFVAAVFAARYALSYVGPVAFTAGYDFNYTTWVVPLAAASLSVLSLRGPIRSGKLTATGLIVRFAVIGLCIGFVGSVVFWASYFAGWSGRVNPTIIGYGFVSAARTALYTLPVALVASLALAGVCAAVLLKRAPPSVAQPTAI